ncbi:MAG TPA: TonB-dependent receptor [Candidatus Polarisedimenticolaceae bacterium]|nr:TonB-dependent receptor [Candidatus Polarisedimenticolaceae bacterium]
MLRKTAGVALAALALIGPARAAEDEPEAPLPSDVEEEVVVTATVARDRRDPAPFTDLDEEQIGALNVGQDLSTLLGETMNAHAYSDAGNGFGYSYLRIRGFDQSRIAVNVNGVPLNTPESKQVYTIDLGDFATGLGLIQIQRGPGTALYGSAAVGGVVNLETAPLSTTAGGELDLTAGSFGTWRASLRYGGPIGRSPWAWSIRAAHVESDGYRRPAWSRQTFANVAFERFGPESVWRVLLFGGPETTQLSYLGVPRAYLDDETLRRTNFLRPGETDTFVQPQLQVMNDRRLAPGLLLKNTLYAIVGEGAFRQFSGTDWRKRALGNRQVGWIPRLTWRHRRGELAAGLELLVHRGRHDGKVEDTSQVLYDYTNEKDTANVFVRETLDVAARTTLSLELQATRHRFAMRKDRVRGISWDGRYAFLTPRIGVNWNATDRWNLYAQATKTESEPSFTNVWDPEDPASDPASRFESFDPSSNRYSDPLAKPERLTGFDVGAGYAHGTTRVKVNLYSMDFRDEFVFAGGLDADGLPITKNAGRSIHRGVEVEGSVRAPLAIDIAGYIAVSDDVLREETVLSPDGAGGAFVIDYSGNRVALFPDRTARLSIARAFGPFRAELAARYVGRIYLDNSENERKTPSNREAPGYVDKRIDPTTVVAAQGVLDLSRWARRPQGTLTARVRVDNLLDAKIAQMGYAYPTDAGYTTFYSEFFPAATRSVLFGLTFGF